MWNVTRSDTGFGFTLLASMGFAGIAAAQDVTLNLIDGSGRIVGDLVEFTGDTFVVTTTLGNMRIAADQVNCVGEACPLVLAAVEPPTRAAPELPEDLPNEVIVSGSETVGLGLMPLLVSGYAAAKGAEETKFTSSSGAETVSTFVGDDGFGDTLSSIRTRSSISSDAFANLIGKSSEIGMASRRIRPAEARALREYGAGIMVDPSNEHIVAIDSIVVITNPSNPVQTLSLDQLRGIYGGTITNWSEVGGSDAPITAVQLLEGSGTRSVFESRVFGTNVIGTPPSVELAEDNTDASDKVRLNPNAIGYVSLAFRRGAQPVTLISDCGIPMTADPFSARTEEYELQRFLYVYTRADTRNEYVQDFVDYATSSRADEVISKSGFIDVGVISQPFPADGPRTAQLQAIDPNTFEGEVAQGMLTQLPAYNRLSSTFRFRIGSSRLNPRGELNLARLTEYLERRPEGTRVLFVGFTDSLGPFSSNLDLAKARSTQVLASVQQFGGERLSGVEMEAVGFGEIAPAACNETEVGSAINRRVEVWISK